MIQFKYLIVWIWHILASMKQNVSVPPCVKVVSLCVKAGSCFCGCLMSVSLYGKLRRAHATATWLLRLLRGEKTPPHFGGKDREREREREWWRGEEGGEKVNLDLVSFHNSSQRVQRAFAERVENRLNCWTLSVLKNKRQYRKKMQLNSAHLTRHWSFITIYVTF